jgi:tetratricopeptide (TPR) repeat protein
VPFPVLLLAHCLGEATVELRLRRGHVDKRVFLEAGVPVDCRSNLLHETIGRFLVQGGKIGEEAYQEALQASAARGALIGEVLVERGAIDATGLFRALQQSLAKKLLDVFNWREGRFEVVSQPPETGSSLKVRVPQLVLTGVARFSPADAVRRWVVPIADLPLALHPEPHFPLGELRLGEAGEQVVTRLAEGPRPLAELAGEGGPSLDDVGRAVAALAMLGAVVPAAALPAVAAAPAPRPSTPAPLAASPRPEASEAEANALHRAFLEHRRQDAFDLLEVGEDAPLAFVQYQFLEFARRFAPWRFEPDGGSGLADQARELFLAGTLAYAELASAESRDALRFRRQRQREEDGRQRTASYFQIQTDLLDPEAQFTRALALREAGKLHLAVEHFAFASDCDPGNALYLAELAWTRLLEAPGRGAKALEELEEALRIDPGCGLAHYYAGEVHRQLRNWTRAEECLRRAIKPMAPDRRPLDALHALAAERRR